MHFRQRPDSAFAKAIYKRIPGGRFGALVLVVVFFVIPVFLVSALAPKLTPVYKDAVARAKENRVVQQALGAPIKEGMFVSGSGRVGGSVDGAPGHVDISVTISGPKGTATLYVVASRPKEQWIFKTLMVKVAETGQRIDLTE